MNKAIALIALGCFLVAVAAATSVLSRDSIPQAGAAVPFADLKNVVANREAKQDKLTGALAASAASDPQQTASLNEPLRQAFASSSDADIEAAKAANRAAAMVAPAAIPMPPPKPKLVSRPQLQKPYALLSDAQIAGIKERLKLSSSQESYWPPVEEALRVIAHKIHAARVANPSATAAQLDPDSAEVQQLKSAAMPLLFQLREDQKDEVRKLARVIGLEKVAAAI